MALLYHDFMYKCIDRKDFQLIWKKQIALFGKFIRVFVKEKIKKGNTEKEGKNTWHLLNAMKNSRVIKTRT